jgi:hypothetical protein
VQAKSKKTQNKFEQSTIFVAKNWLVLAICFALLLPSVLISFFAFNTSGYFNFLSRPEMFFNTSFIIACFVLLVLILFFFLFWSVANRQHNLIKLTVLALCLISMFFIVFFVFNILWLSIMLLGGAVVVCGLLLYEKTKILLLTMLKTLAIMLSATVFIVFYILFLFN